MRKKEIEETDFERLCKKIITQLKEDNNNNINNRLTELISSNTLTETLMKDQEFVSQLKELFKNELMISPSDFKIHNTLYVIECILREEYVNNKKLSPDELDEISGGTFDKNDPSLSTSLEFLEKNMGNF